MQTSFQNAEIDSKRQIKTSPTGATGRQVDMKSSSHPELLR